jgi:hypothetical protein
MSYVFDQEERWDIQHNTYLAFMVYLDKFRVQ